MHVKHHKTCRICGNEHLTEVLDLGRQHIQGAFEHPNNPSPPRRQVSNRIVRCDTSKDENACGLIQADVSISPEILYRNYWYQSGISQTMTKHLRSIVEETVGITGFKDGLVIDIAANDFSLLRNYRDYGDYRMLAIDPSNISAQQQDADIELINDVFPNKKAKFFNASIITSIACFYDVNEPELFALGIKNNLNKDGVWIAEFAYWPSMLTNLAYDQILNEHVCHYHLAPFERLLFNTGLKLFRAEKTPTNGGSIMCYICHDFCDKYENKDWTSNLRQLRFEEFEAELDEESTYLKFRHQVSSSLSSLWYLIQKINEGGGTVHLYGSSTKVNVTLQAAHIGPDQIPFAAERSESKWGASTLSKIKIISEDESRAMNPTHYLCSLVGFKKEILEREKEFLDNGGTFIFLPELTLVDKNTKND